MNNQQRSNIQECQAHHIIIYVRWNVGIKKVHLYLCFCWFILIYRVHRIETMHGFWPHGLEQGQRSNRRSKVKQKVKGQTEGQVRKSHVHPPCSWRLSHPATLAESGRFTPPVWVVPLCPADEFPCMDSITAPSKPCNTWTMTQYG